MPSALLCPQCWLKTSVLETRPSAGGLQRRRACSNGHRITTIEKAIMGRDDDRQIGETVLISRDALSRLRALVVGARERFSKLVELGEIEALTINLLAGEGDEDPDHR